MKKRLVLSSILSLTTLPLLAAQGEVIPGEAVAWLILLFLVGGLVIALLISFLLKLIFQAIRKERRSHIVFMTILSFAFPGIFAYADEKYQLLYELEVTNSYETRQLVFWILFVLFILIGFMVGYFITPKKK
ncbi:MAG: hypothetical protein MI810_02065 [Flavobacteriales bacterium]|nr:hypothetical protein [Flavobacteriales bacterium]